MDIKVKPLLKTDKVQQKEERERERRKKNRKGLTKNCGIQVFIPLHSNFDNL